MDGLSDDMFSFLRYQEMMQEEFSNMQEKYDLKYQRKSFGQQLPGTAVENH